MGRQLKCLGVCQSDLRKKGTHLNILINVQIWRHTLLHCSLACTGTRVCVQYRVISFRPFSRTACQVAVPLVLHSGTAPASGPISRPGTIREVAARRIYASVVAEMQTVHSIREVDTA